MNALLNDRLWLLLIEDAACCIFASKNRQLKFHRTPYPNYHFKEQIMFFFAIIITIVLGKIL